MSLLLNGLNGIIAAAKAVTGVAGAIGVVNQTANYVTDSHRRLTSTSLTQLTNQTTVRSRVYIDDSISRDPVVTPILKTAHTMYVGMILNALQLQNLVTAGHTVRDSLSVIQTGSMASFQDIMPKLDQLQASLESVKDDYDERRRKAIEDAQIRKEVKDIVDPPKPEKTHEDKHEDARQARISADKISKEFDTPKPLEPKLNAKDITPAPADMFPVGKLIDVTLTNPQHPEASQNVAILVQMLPYLMPTHVVSLILSMSGGQTVGQRWAQFKAGEISFWRDLVFQVDKIQKLQKGVRDDKSGAFNDYVKDVSKKDSSRIGHIFTAVTGGDRTVPSSNISNAVLIVSEDAVMQAKADGNVDLENDSSRAAFFASSYCMMVFVVDQAYHQVTLYMNGVSDVGHYSFDQFQSSKKGFEATDLVSILSAMSQNRAPRF